MIYYFVSDDFNEIDFADADSYDYYIPLHGSKKPKLGDTGLMISPYALSCAIAKIEEHEKLKPIVTPSVVNRSLMKFFWENINI
jgi:hypothetical protein